MQQAETVEAMPTTKKKTATSNNYTIRQQIRLDEQLFEEVQALADEQERSLSMMLRILVKLGLERVQEQG